MKHLFITILLLLPLCRMLAQEREYVIVVHGGAGAMENLEDDKEKSTLYYAALDSALSIGNAILSAGGEGPEAVMAAPTKSSLPGQSIIFNFFPFHST